MSPTTTTNYSVSGTSALGCVSSTSAIANVSVTSTPTLVVNPVTICTGNTATLTVSSASSYTWNPGNVTGSTYTIAPSSSTVVTVIGANGSCTTQTTGSVTVASSLSITVNSPIICAGQTTTLTASGATTYTWNTGVNTTSIVVTPTATTVYTVSGSTAGCSGANTSTVTVNAVPTLTATSVNICSGQTATITASGANTYTWSNGVNTASQTVSPTTTTNYSVSGTSALGCVSSRSVTSTVSVTPTPTLTVNSANICTGNTATLTASGAGTYTWNTTATTNSISVSPTTTTNYTVIGANGSCVSQTVTSVTVFTIVVVSYTNSFNSCPNQPVTITAATSNTVATTYTWTNGVNTFSQMVTPNATTVYNVVGSIANGCPALSGTITVNVNAIAASFSGMTNTVATVGTNLTLTNTSTGATSFGWKYCNGGISNSSTITIPLNTIGNCCVTLIASNASCTDSVTKCINVVSEASIKIPNVFTPNGDNVNDVFTIISSGLKSLHCAIFDRWGLKLYEWDGISGGWDGHTRSGIKTPSGTYFYVLEYTDQLDVVKSDKGFLNMFNE